ncbi:ATP-grasp domain-containing protein [Sorangium sp. So ce131]|uniref:ATP-grasp domain-containing protein n=1 Tax=Sorangium sp. So ce131 TaxID=3133282 RepID=UPI003F5F8472
MHILLIGGPRPMHPAVLKRARVTHVVRRSKAAAPDLAAAYVRVLVVRDDEPDEAIAGCARAIDAVDPLDRVVCLHDEEQLTAASVARALGRPFLHAPEIVARARDKRRMRDHLRAVGFEEVESETVEGLDRLLAFASRVGFPLIVKPIDGQGSISIHKARSERDLRRIHGEIVARPGAPRYVVERFLEGEEYSVEALSEGGVHRVLAVTGKLWHDDESFVETGYIVPAPIPPQRDAEIRAYVRAALTALEIHDGPTHTELKYTAQGPRLIETHTRVGGDSIAELVRLATDVDYIGLVVRQALGESVLGEIPEEPAFPRAAAVRFSLPPGSGRVERVEGVEEARRMPGVAYVEVFVAPGAWVDPHPSYPNRRVMAGAIGADREEALGRAERARDVVRLVLSAGDPAHG